MALLKHAPAACGSRRCFADGEKLLAECERLGLEGIVSKRQDQPYRSIRSDWIKVKTKAWREANRDRRELFK